MNFHFDEAILADMKKKKKSGISVEVATSNCSDFEVSEIFFRYVTDDFAKYLHDKKGYRVLDAGSCKVCLPPYRLHYEEEITFERKKSWIFPQIVCSGIRL